MFDQIEAIETFVQSSRGWPSPGDNPPTFREIRSLAGRLYKDAYGEEFAQKLLGHTSETTTKMYLDERDQKAFLML